MGGIIAAVVANFTGQVQTRSILEEFSKTVDRSLCFGTTDVRCPNGMIELPIRMVQ